MWLIINTGNKFIYMYMNFIAALHIRVKMKCMQISDVLKEYSATKKLPSVP